jgi:hypothetical protein
VESTDLVNQKKAEAEAQKAGRDSQRAIEPGQAVGRVSERQTDRRRDEHHSGDRPHAEDAQIDNTPRPVANGRQREQGDRG